MTPDPLGATLYLVGTPIGHLGDITQRALDILREVTVILAEDTRKARILLSHFDIPKKKLLCFNEHATPRLAERILETLEGGQDCALVTDAGMPAISDPGARLAQAAHRAQIRVVTLPGPSAVTTAAAASGLVDGPFLFLGFLPRKGSKRTSALVRISSTSEAVILFEAANRTTATLKELAELCPDRPACIARELTKLHEELVHGTIAELAVIPKVWRGEVTLVLAAHAVEPRHKDSSLGSDPATLDAAIEAGLKRGLSVKSLTSELQQATGLPRRDLYQKIQACRDSSPPD